MNLTHWTSQAGKKDAAARAVQFNNKIVFSYNFDNVAGEVVRKEIKSSCLVCKGKGLYAVPSCVAGVHDVQLVPCGCQKKEK